MTLIVMSWVSRFLGLIRVTVVQSWYMRTLARQGRPAAKGKWHVQRILAAHSTKETLAASGLIGTIPTRIYRIKNYQHPLRTPP